MIFVHKMHSRKRKMETTLVDDELSSLSDQELREQLKAVGEDAGPMDSSTRLAGFYWVQSY